MKTSIPRIRRIRLKDGGADLTIIDGGTDEAAEGLLRNAQDAQEVMDNMAGYVIVGWNFQGRYVRAFFCHDRSPVQYTRMPSFIHDVLLKEVTEGSVYDALGLGEL